MIELTFAGDATGDSILNSGLVPPNRVLEVVKNGKGRLYSVSSRVLTVRQGEKTVTTAEDFEHEANAASGSLYTLAVLHKAGIIKIASLNEVQVE
jgi:hypothetical protein